MSIRDQFMSIRVKIFFLNMNYHEYATNWNTNYLLF